MATASYDHHAFAEALRRRTLEGYGETSVIDRQRAATVAAGDSIPATPFDRLARQIGEAAYRVSDAQVAEARAAAGSQKVTFEIVAAAALGPGLARWVTSTLATVFQPAVDPVHIDGLGNTPSRRGTPQGAPFPDIASAWHWAVQDARAIASQHVLDAGLGDQWMEIGDERGAVVGSIPFSRALRPN